MAKVQIPIAGAFVGPVHAFTKLLTAGHSLHPLQRVGAVDWSGVPVGYVANTPGIGGTVSAGGPVLAMPPVLDTSITTAVNWASRV